MKYRWQAKQAAAAKSLLKVHATHFHSRKECDKCKFTWQLTTGLRTLFTVKSVNLLAKNLSYLYSIYNLLSLVHNRVGCQQKNIIQT